VNPNSLRICILSHEYPPDTGWGGIATFAYHLAHGLVEIGHEVEVVTLAKAEEREVLDGGVKVHHVLPYLKDTDLGLIWRAMPYGRVIFNWAPALWKKLLEQHQMKPFDVIDAPELLGDAILPSMTKIAPLAIRLYTPHSKFIAERFHNASESFDHQFMAMVERVAMVNAEAITSPSLDLAKFVASDLDIPLGEIALIANPIDAVKFNPEGARAINSSDTLNVLFVGRLEERKGIGYLVQAIPEIVRAVPNVHFYIIGDDPKNGPGETSVLAQLKQIIVQANCQANVTFINRVPLDDLPKYYRSADVCVVPSLYDNSPYTCLEAMACGRVVIGTASGGTGEYLVNGESGVLVEAKNSSAIAQAVINQLRNPEERSRLEKNARQRVMEKFQRSEIARQTAELYNLAIERFKARHRNPLYSRDPSRILADLDNMMTSLNVMFHKLLWQHSYRYRVANLLHRIRTRPRLFAAELMLKVLKAPFGSETTNVDYPALVVWLEKQISLKHQAIVDAARLSTVGQIER
jgi:glycosyltransferase involved in cell wall biosynthesis